MGEAKRRLTLNDRLLRDQPHCIYCGGGTLASDVDHVPPISIFDGRQRPREPIVSICKPCHEGTRAGDSLAAVMSRLYPNPETDVQRNDLAKAAKAMVRHHLDIAHELGLHDLDGDDDVAPLSVGPLLSHHMNRFAARLGYALHFLKLGHPIPLEGGTFVRWYSNADALQGRLPTELLELLGPDQTLTQGRFSVEDQFSYATANQGERHVFFCSFRRSFATLSITSDDVSLFPSPMPDNDRMFRPAFLKS